MRDFLVCLALLLATPVASAQQAGALLPDSAAGAPLAVTTTSGRGVRGRLVADGNGALVLSLADRREQTIAHADIQRVTQRHNRFLFGPLIGLAAGLAVGLPAQTRLDNEGVDGQAVLAWAVGTGVAIGTLIDLFNGSDRTIYTSKPGAVTGLQLRSGTRGAALGWAIAW